MIWPSKWVSHVRRPSLGAHESAPEMTTLPGTSNHSWGVAVDFDIDLYTSYENPEVVWLVENGPAYGWRNPTHEAFGTLRPEPWHFEFWDAMPTLPDNGFYGPTPEVEYVFNLPEGWPGPRQSTRLTSNGLTLAWPNWEPGRTKPQDCQVRAKPDDGDTWDREEDAEDVAQCARNSSV